MSGDQLRQEVILDVVARNLNQAVKGLTQLAKLQSELSKQVDLNVTAKTKSAVDSLDAVYNKAQTLKNIQLGIDTSNFKRSLKGIETDLTSLEKRYKSFASSINTSLQNIGKARTPTSLSSNLTSQNITFNSQRQIDNLFSKHVAGERARNEQLVKITEQRNKLLSQLDKLSIVGVSGKRIALGDLIDPNGPKGFSDTQFNQEDLTDLSTFRKTLEKRIEKIKASMGGLKKSSTEYKKLSKELKERGEQLKEVKFNISENLKVFDEFFDAQFNLKNITASKDATTTYLEGISNKLDNVRRRTEEQLAKIAKKEDDIRRITSSRKRSTLSRGLGSTLSSALESGDTELAGILNDPTIQSQVRTGKVGINQIISSLRTEKKPSKIEPKTTFYGLDIEGRQGLKTKEELDKIRASIKSEDDGVSGFLNSIRQDITSIEEETTPQALARRFKSDLAKITPLSQRPIKTQEETDLGSEESKQFGLSLKDSLNKIINKARIENYAESDEKFYEDLKKRELKVGQFNKLEDRQFALRLNQDETGVSPRQVSVLKNAQRQIDKSKGYVSPQEIERIAEDHGILSSALKGNKFFDLGRVKQSPETQKQIAFALLFGGLPGAAGSAIGGAIGGSSGALAGSVVSQFLVDVVEKPVEAAKEKFKELADAGLVVSRSILGIAAIENQTSRVVDSLGRPQDIGTTLGFQQQQAANIQFTARQKLLPIGIAGQTEATFVQGITSALAQRGFQTTPEQIARISQLIGGAIQAQRPQLLDNPSLLLRDIQDVLGGGALARRTVLYQLARSQFSKVQSARSTDQIVQALQPLQGYTEAVTQSKNPTVAFNQLNSAIENLKVSAGGKLLDNFSEAISKLAEAIRDPKVIDGANKLGAALGKLGAYFVDLQADFLKFVSNSHLDDVASNLIKIGPDIALLGASLAALSGTLVILSKNSQAATVSLEKTAAKESLATSPYFSGGAESALSKSRFIPTAGNLLGTASVATFAALVVKELIDTLVDSYKAKLDEVNKQEEDRAKKIIDDRKGLKSESTPQNTLQGILTRVGLFEELSKFNVERQQSPGIVSEQLGKAIEVINKNPETRREFLPFVLSNKQKADLAILDRQQQIDYDTQTPTGRRGSAQFFFDQIAPKTLESLKGREKAENQIIEDSKYSGKTPLDLLTPALPTDISGIFSKNTILDQLTPKGNINAELSENLKQQKADEDRIKALSRIPELEKLQRREPIIRRLLERENEFPDALINKIRKEFQNNVITQSEIKHGINPNIPVETFQNPTPEGFDKFIKSFTKLPEGAQKQFVENPGSFGSFGLPIQTARQLSGFLPKDAKEGIKRVLGISKEEVKEQEKLDKSKLQDELTSKKLDLKRLLDNEKELRNTSDSIEDQTKQAREALKNLAVEFSQHSKDILKNFKELLSAIDAQVQQRIQQIDTSTFGGQQSASFEAFGGNLEKLQFVLNQIDLAQKTLKVDPNNKGALDNLKEYQAQRGQLEAQSAGLFNRIFQAQKQQSDAQKQYTKQTKALNSTIDGELDQRKKLNLTLQDSIFALKEFKDEARLRELNAGLSGRSQALSFQEKYGYLPANAAPESLYNQDVLKSIEQQRDQEAIDAAARIEANRPIKEGLEQDRLTQEVENNQKAFTSLTETIEQTRKQLEQLRQDFAEKNNPLYDFRSGGDQSLGLPSNINPTVLTLGQGLSDKFNSLGSRTSAIDTVKGNDISLPKPFVNFPISKSKEGLDKYTNDIYKPTGSIQEFGSGDVKAKEAIDFIESSVKQVNDVLPSGINKFLTQAGVTEAIGPEIKDIDPALAAQQAEGRGGLTNNENGALYNPEKKQLLISAKNRKFLKDQIVHEKGHAFSENLSDLMKIVLNSDFIKDASNKNYNTRIKESGIDPFFIREINDNAEKETTAQTFANYYKSKLGTVGKPGLDQVYPTLTKDYDSLLQSFEQKTLSAPDFSKKYPFAFVPRHDKSKKGSTKETVSVGDTQGEDLIPVDGSQPVAVSAALKVTDQSTKDQKGKYNVFQKFDGHAIYPAQKKAQEEIKKIVQKVKGVLPSPSFSQVRPRSPEEIEATGTGLTYVQEGYKDFSENMEKLDRLNSLKDRLDFEGADPNNINKNYGLDFFKANGESVEDSLKQRVDKNLKGKRLFPSPNFSQDPYQKGIEEGKKIDPFALGAFVDVQLAKANKVQNLQEEPDVFADLAKQDQDRKKNIFGGDLSEGHTKESGEEFLKSLSISKPQGNNDIAAAGTEREAIAKLEESLGAKLEDIVKVLVENAKNTPDAQTLRSIMTEAVQAGNERSFS